jgi:iron complex outermembrane receptor protein
MLTSKVKAEHMDRFTPRSDQAARLPCLLLALLLPVLNAQHPPTNDAEQAALKKLSLEELSQIEVTSAGKKEEKLSNVAAAVYVITQEEIRRSGVRNVPEALRTATALEVAMFNAGSWPISARGFDITSTNKLQVFIDGRSVYSPLFGGVLWDLQSVVMENIDRIEVIRGPERPCGAEMPSTA